MIIGVIIQMDISLGISKWLKNRLKTLTGKQEKDQWQFIYIKYKG